MKKIIGSLLAAFILILLVSSVTQAISTCSGNCCTDSLPSGDPAYTDQQLILTCIPDNWNGQLVVYAHGYTPPQESVLLPFDELKLPDGTNLPDVLASYGFAFATTSYHKNGYAIEQAGNDINSLVTHFKSLVTNGPEKVYLIGSSEGGLIVTMLLEKNYNMYDAGLAICSPIAGMPHQIKYAGDFRVIFDYYFPQIFNFGAADVPANAFQSWDSYVNFITNAMAGDPSSTKNLFKVTRAAVDSHDPSSAVNTALSVLFLNIWGADDLVEVAGGQPYDNRHTWYWGSSSDRKLNARVERIGSDKLALDYVRNFYQPTGKLKRPLVTLHTTLDELVPFDHEIIYSGQVFASGLIKNLTVLPIQRYGHCNFTGQEILGAFELMIKRTNK